MKKACLLSLLIAAVAFSALPAQAGGPKGPSPSPGLTPAERDNILYLYEEEKVARDVYAAMYDIHGAFVFDAIGASEQRHMDAVKKLADKYGIVLPDNDAGVFDNDDLQAAYDALVEKGGSGLTAALEAGVEIEEMDIDDIEEMLGGTDQADIARVLNNLLDGSYNHLEAFTTQLGVTRP